MLFLRRRKMLSHSSGCITGFANIDVVQSTSTNNRAICPGIVEHVHDGPVGIALVQRCPDPDGFLREVESFYFKAGHTSCFAPAIC